MSASIRIPPRNTYSESSKAPPSSSSSSSYASSPSTPQQQQPTSGSGTPPSSSDTAHGHIRRRSLLGSSFTKQEHTVINIGDPDGVPRLITCVRSSQGFDWNPEIFLPAYIECDFESLDRKREPVHEIRLSDDEVKQLLPQ